MKKTVLVILVVAVVAAVAAYLYLPPSDTSSETELTVPEEPQPPEKPPEPEYPVPGMPAPEPPEQTTPATDSAGPTPELPSLQDSDVPVQDAVDNIFGMPDLETLFNFDGLVRRLVVTIDNLPRRRLSLKHLPVQTAPGQFLVAPADAGQDEVYVIRQENYDRYTPYVKLLESLDTDTFTDLYTQYYPLFQEAYVELGYPSAYFNDRLVSVIDHLLATPQVDRPVRLVRPHVLYKFADPDLEQLSSGQKAMIRMGPENAERVKAKLREIRAKITAFDAAAEQPD